MEGTRSRRMRPTPMHGAARSDAGDERVGLEPHARQLIEKFGTRRAVVRLDVRIALELVRQENAVVGRRVLVGLLDAAEESAGCLRDRNDLRRRAPA